MKKSYKIISIVILLAFVFSPIMLCVLKVNESWIGFWGGYLGAIFSGMITLWVMYCTMKEEKQIAKENNRRENNKYLLEKLADYVSFVENLARRWNKYFSYVLLGKDLEEYYTEALQSLQELNKSGMIVGAYLRALWMENDYEVAEPLYFCVEDITKTLSKYKDCIQTRDFSLFNKQEFDKDLEYIEKRLVVISASMHELVNV